MAGIQVPYWVNNQTRLNATNMNSMSNAINKIVTQLYGETDDGGLVRTVDTHNMYFVGEANVPNSGVFKQIGQLGKALLTPTFCDGNDNVQAYSYDDIRNYEVTLPNVSRYNWWNVGPNNEVESTNPTFKLSLGVSGNDTTPRSLVGNSDSFTQKFADNAVDVFNRIESMGATYRPKGIFFNPTYNSYNPGGSIKTQVIEAEDTDTLKVTTGIFAVGNGNTAALQLGRSSSEDSWIGYAKDVRINNGVVYIGSDGDNSVATITPANGIALRGQLSLTGAASLQSTLQVTGKTELGNELSVANNTNLGAELSVTGKTTLENTLSVANDATFSKNASVTENLTVSGQLQANSDTQLNGPVSIANTLFVDKSVTFNSGATITGDSTFNDNLDVLGTLEVTKTSTLGDRVTISKNGLAVTGDSSFANNLSITGALTVNSGATITGNSTFNNNIAVKGASTFNDKVTITANGLDATGDSIFNNKLTVKEATVLDSTLAVSSTSTFGDKVTVSKGGIEVSGPTVLKNSLTVTNGATLNSTLQVKGNTTLQAALGVTGAITANDNLSVAKEASIKTLVANTADVKDASGNYVQGTNTSSVVVVGTDDDTNTFKGEVKARTEADAQITKDYKAADETLQKTIVGNDTDTIEDNTLRGVINYANAEIESIRDLLNALEDTDVITAQPSVTLSTKNGTVDTVKAWEVGTDVTPKYSITFNAGTYQYGPSPTGCTAQTWYAKFGEVEKTTKTGTFDAVHVVDSTSIQLEVSCTYSDGGVPLSDLGREIPNSRIKAGTTEKKTATLTGFRQAFAGGMTSKTTVLDSKNIRLLPAKGGNKKTFDVAITGDAVRVVVAFPDSWGSLTKALDVNDSSKNIVTSFQAFDTVDVSGATAGLDEIPYKLYVMDFASAYGGSGNTYTITIS